MLCARRIQAPLVTRSYNLLQSEKPCTKLADKIVRDARPKTFYKHASYVFVREKMLSTLWRDAGLFQISMMVLVPFYAVTSLAQQP